MRRRTSAVAAALLLAAAATCARARPDLPTPAPAPAAPPEEIDVTLFLIGDAGGAPHAATDPVLAALHAALTAAPGALVVFLGDNVYPRGMPDSAAPARREAERRLDAQLAALRGTGARGIFIPGNHDWAKHGADGWDAVRRAEAFIAASGWGAVQLPAGGCPGPAVVDAGATLRLIAIDTQWWLHGGPKPLHPSSDCPADTPDEIVASLASAGTAAGGRVVVVAAHHPIRTGGPHGGYFGIADHLFPLRELGSWLWLPLPLIGSVYPIARASGISSQDAPSGSYRAMSARLEEAFAQFRPLVYAAGHEHGLQVIAGGAGARHLLVSGGGNYGHASRLVALDSTRYARGRAGYMRLDVLNDRRVRLGVVVVDAAGRGTEEFSLWLQ